MNIVPLLSRRSPAAGPAHQGRTLEDLLPLLKSAVKARFWALMTWNFGIKQGDFFWVSIVSMGLNLVGGDWNHGILWLSIQLGMSSSQLTFAFFQRGRYTTNKLIDSKLVIWVYHGYRMGIQWDRIVEHGDFRGFHYQKYWFEQSSHGGHRQGNCPENIYMILYCRFLMGMYHGPN